MFKKLSLFLCLSLWSFFSQAAPVFNFSNYASIGDLEAFGPVDTNYGNPSEDHGSIESQIRFGIKEVGAKASVSGSSTSIFSAYSQAQSEYLDTFFMNAIGFDGLPVLSGTFMVNTVFHANTSASGGGIYSAYASADGGVTVNGISRNLRSLSTASGLGINSPNSKSEPMIFQVIWTFGQPISLRMYAAAEADGYSSDRFSTGPGTFNATSDIFNTVSWGGITDVLDQQGNPVASFTALNNEGLDYAYGATVVPLSPAAWLFGSGLISLFGIARRKKA